MFTGKMKRIFILVLLGFSCGVSLSRLHAQNNISLAGSSGLYFIENKGQVKDQYGKPRGDIQYAVPAAGITVFIGNGQLHYQFAKRNEQPGQHTPSPVKKAQVSDPFSREVPEMEGIRASTVEMYRMDVTLLGANNRAEVITGKPLAYYENYYLPGCGIDGIRVHTCQQVTYKNIYPGIDWVISIKDNKLEHEFVVRNGGNVHDIKLRYSGQTSLTVGTDGALTAITPMGAIKEHAPVCYRSADRSAIPSSYKLEGDELSYNIKKQGAVTIDPVLEWATYYGTKLSTTMQYGVACSDSGHVYSCGLTWSVANIATVGTFQTVEGGQTDAFIVKFDSLGHRMWGTYFGGVEDDLGKGIACDRAGNVYLGGITRSPSDIATPGVQQPVYGGGWDCFIAKFTNTGDRLWGSYAGDMAGEDLAAVACDRAGHVMISGVTDSWTNIASAGGFLTVAPGGHNAFLIQYDAVTGLRTWGTYYGGDGDDYSGSICTDKLNNIYFSGYTQSTTGITSAGAWRPTMWGSTGDAFLAKFDVVGNRLWATYYGGESQESAGAVICDTFGNPYLLGATSSDSGIATPGCSQPVRGGSADAFLALFEPSTGFRVWGTYFGGPGAEDVASVRSIATDDSSNVFITGHTASTSGIATAGAWQTTYGGGDEDAFLAKYTSSGYLAWSTYFGGSDVDMSRAAAFDGQGIYICGVTTSTNNIATPGAFLDTGGGSSAYYQGFIARFNVIVPCAPGVLSGPSHLCKGDTISLTNSVTGGTWTSGSPAVATVDGSGFVNGLSAGVTTITYQFFAGCYAVLRDTVDTCSIVPVVSGVTGVTGGNKIHIYPNPATTEFTVSVSIGTYSSYIVRNTLGQELLSGFINTASTVVDITALPPGLYYIALKGVDGFTEGKLLKE